MPEPIRSFLAVELTPEIQQALSLIQDQLKQSGADVRWVKPANIHVTLKFLGNVSVENSSWSKRK
jgi:2'-5' RNA ligase